MTPTTPDVSSREAHSNDQTIDQTFTVTGMSCSGCANTVLRTVGSLGGVESASVDFHKAIVHVSYNPTRLDVHALKNAVDALGYHLVLPTS